VEWGGIIMEDVASDHHAAEVFRRPRNALDADGDDPRLFAFQRSEPG
jgi:hypothetical protein